MRELESIDKAINFAAEKLPEGCQIIISIENGGYGVEVEIPLSSIKSEVISLSEESIICDIVAATNMAIRLV